MQEGKKAVILLSGGLDSTTLLHVAVKELKIRQIYALSMSYGQKHSKELEMAKWQAKAVGVVDHTILDISFLGTLLKGSSALVDPDMEIAALDNLEKDQLDQPPTYVPNRNMILLSIAAARAEAVGASEVLYGAQAQDRYGYWDCTVDFVEKINHVLGLNCKNRVEIKAPFAELSKARLVAMGVKLGVDYSKTWSCYRGGQYPCGECPTCVERSRAFEEAGVTDSLAGPQSAV